MTVQEVIAEIAKNNKGEQDAIEGYFRLLSEIRKNGLPQELYAQVEEIISDEMHHSLVLGDWVSRLSYIKPKLD